MGICLLFRVTFGQNWAAADTGYGSYYTPLLGTLPTPSPFLRNGLKRIAFQPNKSAGYFASLPDLDLSYSVNLSAKKFRFATKSRPNLLFDDEKNCVLCNFLRKDKNTKSLKCRNCTQYLHSLVMRNPNYKGRNTFFEVSPGSRTLLFQEL